MEEELVPTNNYVCRYFYFQLRCKADRCPFPHVQYSYHSIDNFCRFFKRGICPYGERCKFEHAEIVKVGNVWMIKRKKEARVDNHNKKASKSVQPLAEGISSGSQEKTLNKIVKEIVPEEENPAFISSDDTEKHLIPENVNRTQNVLRTSSHVTHDTTSINYKYGRYTDSETINQSLFPRTPYIFQNVSLPCSSDKESRFLPELKENKTCPVQCGGYESNVMKKDLKETDDIQIPDESKTSAKSFHGSFSVNTKGNSGTETFNDSNYQTVNNPNNTSLYSELPKNLQPENSFVFFPRDIDIHEDFASQIIPVIPSDTTEETTNCASSSLVSEGKLNISPMSETSSNNSSHLIPDMPNYTSQAIVSPNSSENLPGHDVRNNIAMEAIGNKSSKITSPRNHNHLLLAHVSQLQRKPTSVISPLIHTSQAIASPSSSTNLPDPDVGSNIAMEAISDNPSKMAPPRNQNHLLFASVSPVHMENQSQMFEAHNTSSVESQNTSFSSQNNSEENLHSLLRLSYLYSYSNFLLNLQNTALLNSVCELLLTNLASLFTHQSIPHILPPASVDDLEPSSDQPVSTSYSFVHQQHEENVALLNSLQSLHQPNLEGIAASLQACQNLPSPNSDHLAPRPSEMSNLATQFVPTDYQQSEVQQNSNPYNSTFPWNNPQ